MTITIYAVIVTALLIGAISLIVYLFRKKPSPQIYTHLKTIASLNTRIDELKSENANLKQTREKLENESKKRFDSDTGAAVAADLAD